MGKLIVLEGLDGSGKLTQLKMLKERLIKDGYPVDTFDFPQYDSFFGALVGKYLRGEFGSMVELPVEIPTLLYALDRYYVRDDIEESLEENIVLLNRYTPSNTCFQGAKLKGKDRDKFIKWVGAVEARLPRPDLVLFLDVPRYIARNLIGNKDLRKYLNGKKQDIHEKNDPYQEEVESLYRRLVRERKNWIGIKCVEYDLLLKVEEIHDKIWKVVKRELG